MEDGYIADFQLTSSSSSPGHPVEGARPDGVGWCSEPRDQHSYIQVFVDEGCIESVLCSLNLHI